MKLFAYFRTNRFVNHLSAKLRVTIIGVVLLLGFGVAVVLFAWAFADDLYDAKRQSLTHVVSLARNAMEPIVRDKQNGEITLAQARLRATEAVSRFVYTDQDGANFLFLTTYEGYLLVDPAAPEKVGTYQMQRQDKEGVPLTRLFLEKARAGGGFVVSTESRVSGEAPQKKISYVIGIPEIECYLGTGIFVNELDAAVTRLTLEILALGFVIFALVFWLQYYFMQPLLRIVEAMSDCFKRLSEDPASLKALDENVSHQDPDVRDMVANFGILLQRLQLYQAEILHQAEEHKLIAHAANDIIWQWERSGGKTRWSKNIQDMIGYLPVIDETHFEVNEEWVHRQDRAKRRQALAAYFAGNSDLYVCEYRVLSGDGGYRRVRARGLATFDENGAPDRMVGSMIDIEEFLDGERSVEKPQGSVTEYSMQILADVVQQIPAVSRQTLVADVKNRLEAEKWQGIVVTDQDVPVGLVMKSSLNQHLSTQYGVSLYSSRSVELLMDKAPLLVDIGLPLEKVAELANQRSEEKLYDLIIVTKDDRYHGTVSVMDLLRQLSDLRIQLAMNANPLTGLPGNRVIDQKIQMAIQQNSSFVAVYIDLDNFKAFNDKYGFERGDAAIKLTAEVLQSQVDKYGGAEGFVGHIGGDDFFVLLVDASASYVVVAEQIIKEFDEKIRSLYSPSDLAQGCIAVASRKKSIERYPMMSISLAVVDSCCHSFQNFLEVAELAAELKHRAKSIEGSVWVQERRCAAKIVNP